MHIHSTTERKIVYFYSSSTAFWMKIKNLWKYIYITINDKLFWSYSLFKPFAYVFIIGKGITLILYYYVW